MAGDGAPVAEGTRNALEGSLLGRRDKQARRGFQEASSTEAVGAVRMINYKINFSWFNHTLS